MSQSSPMSSATAAGAAVILAPLIAWFVVKWNLDMPAAAQASMAALLVGGAHWLGNLLTQRIASRRAPMPAAPAAPPQAGFARVSMLLFIAATAGAALMLGGCASLTEAGNVAYTVEPVADQNGKLVCCRFSAHDGKEFSGRNITFQKGDDGSIALQVQEGASSAFQGQAIAEKGLSVLPSFAPVLLPQGPAAK